MRDGGDEAKRLGALARYRLGDLSRHPLIDDLVALTAVVCEAPIALLGILERDRVRVIAAHGVDAGEFPRDDPLWRPMAAAPSIDVHADLTADPAFAAHPLVAGGPQCRFAARAGIVTDDGFLLAVLVVADSRRRRFADLQRATLDIHSRQIAALLELHRLKAAARRPARAASETAPGQGLPTATPPIDLDRAQTEPQVAAESRVPSEQSATEGPNDAAIKRRILVVDDVEAAASLLGKVLESMGHETRVAHDGPKALAIAKEYRPDVILLDLGMPGMSGFVVARLLRAQPGFEGVWLIAVTGHGRDEDRRQALEAGFDHHLLKPVSAEHMRALLDQLPAPKQAA